MTKKTYQTLATDLGRLLAEFHAERGCDDVPAWRVIDVFTTALNQDNPRFDKQRFAEWVEKVQKENA